MTHLKGKKVALLVHNYFEQIEFTSPKGALEAAGATVVVLSAGGSELTGLNHIEKGDSFTADHPIEEVSADEFDAVVLPGGVVNADHLRINVPAQQFVQQMAAQGKPVAAICHAPWLLVSAGLAEAHTLTSYATLQDDIRNAGGEWIDKELVIDENIITSRKPDDLAVFNQAVIDSLAP